MADQNVTLWRSAPAAAAVEQQTVRWLGDFVGFDREATGILLSGGSAANLTALLVALRAVADADADRRAMRVYASAETHFSVARAATALGVGFEAVPVDRDRRLDPTALRDAIALDRAAGLVPICVVANAGTTATGAVDPLDAVAAAATDAGVWMHVDAAYGAPAAADPASRSLFAGLHRADSVCIDAHKWLYAPVDCSALLLHHLAELVTAAEDFELLAGPGAQRLLLSPCAAARRGARAGRAQRADPARAAARRSRLPVQRDDRRALRTPGLHHELPHRTSRRRASRHRRVRARLTCPNSADWRSSRIAP